MRPNLGKLEPVELREIWENEAGHFTPWLASEANLGLLGDAIGLDLELEATEKDVGPFRADILCKDTATGHWVLIENQLARTDHGHLGQLLTYAAGLSAVTVVWIAAPFTDEHRATLDWLNEITDTRFRFFGLEIELWRIDDSPAAPKFNIVSKPNDWTRSVSRAATDIAEALTETRKLQLDFWTAFRDYMDWQSGQVRATKPLPQNWMNFSVGRAQFVLYASVNISAQFIGVGLAMGGPHAKSHFHLLARDKGEIEEEFGEQLEWRERPDRAESHVRLQLLGADPSNREGWPAQHQWLFDKLEKFNAVFRQRIKTLDPAEWQPNDQAAD